MSPYSDEDFNALRDRYERLQRRVHRDRQKTVAHWIGGTFASLVVFVLIFFGYPLWNVWSQGLSGKAALKEAEWSRQIAIKEAQAKDESAGFLAKAEVTRAHGVAKANEIIGVSLKENEAYLRYLWITELKDHGEIIYIPTEANMPIMESVRPLMKRKQ